MKSRQGKTIPKRKAHRLAAHPIVTVIGENLLEILSHYPPFQSIPIIRKQSTRDVVCISHLHCNVLTLKAADAGSAVFEKTAKL